MPSLSQGVSCSKRQLFHIFTVEISPLSTCSISNVRVFQMCGLDLTTNFFFVLSITKTAHTNLFPGQLEHILQVKGLGIIEKLLQNSELLFGFFSLRIIVYLVL